MHAVDLDAMPFSVKVAHGILKSCGEKLRRDGVSLSHALFDRDYNIFFEQADGSVAFGVQFFSCDHCPQLVKRLSLSSTLVFIQ